MSVIIDKAMVLAAGKGTRMRDVCNEIPKPMVPVAGRTLLDRTLDRLVAFGVPYCVVNVSHMAEIICMHLLERTDIQIAFSEEEREPKETGGGVKYALPLLGYEPFFVLNSDALWTEGPVPALQRMAEAFDPELMDVMILLQPIENTVGHDGTGDYYLDDEGLPSRRKPDDTGAPLVYAGAQIISPHVMADMPDGKWSLVRLYDKAEAEGRLSCVIHDGIWYHVGTPEALALAEEQFGGATV